MSVLLLTILRIYLSNRVAKDGIVVPSISVQESGRLSYTARLALLK